MDKSFSLTGLYNDESHLYSALPEKGKMKAETQAGCETIEVATKDKIRKDYQIHEKDTGSSEVQIALLTKRIEDLTEHLKSHKKDHSSRYGLIKMVSARRKLLNYVEKKDRVRYQRLINRLKLRR